MTPQGITTPVQRRWVSEPLSREPGALLLARKNPSRRGLQWSNTADLFAACCFLSWTILLQRYSTEGLRRWQKELKEKDWQPRSRCCKARWKAGQRMEERLPQGRRKCEEERKSEEWGGKKKRWKDPNKRQESTGGKEE